MRVRNPTQTVSVEPGPAQVLESGSPDAEQAVLLLPGALCTPAFYDDLLAEPTLSATPTRFVATTLPGYGGTPPPDDADIEAYAASAARLARDHRCDVVVGHSLGANIAIEMVAVGEFSGPVVLLSPSFSLKDESRFPRALDKLGRVLGPLPFAAMFKMIGPAMKGELPPDRHEALTAELKKNDPGDVRRVTRPYLQYLGQQRSLVSRLRNSGVRAWVAFGENGDVGLRDDERRGLEEASNVTLVEIADGGHFALNQQPARVADLVRDALAAAT